MNKRTKFFEWWAAEGDIRLIAKDYKNTYSVGIFACCRELHSPKRHCDYFKGTEEEAKVHFTVRLNIRYQSLVSEDSKKKEEAIRKVREVQAQKLAQIEALEEKVAESNCKLSQII